MQWPSSESDSENGGNEKIGQINFGNHFVIRNEFEMIEEGRIPP